jgi:hypothetical protein
MYHLIKAWAIFASLLTAVPGTTTTIASQQYSASTFVNPTGNSAIAQESEDDTPETPETPETPDDETSDDETPPTPDVPSTPDTPETPETPATPATPEPEVTPQPTPEPIETPKPTPTEPSAPVEQPTPETMPPEEVTEPAELILDAQGELVDGDQVLESDNSLYDEYTFDGEEGQSITVTLDSSDFDTYLAVFTPDDKLLEEHDDVSQTDSNSAITVTLPATGVYRVIVNSYDSKGRGSYTLKIR